MLFQKRGRMKELSKELVDLTRLSKPIVVKSAKLAVQILGWTKPLQRSGGKK